MSYLTMVNKVLRLLREETVSTVTETDYSTMIGVMMNLVKEEVEDASDWNVLNSTVQLTTASGTWQYTITSADYRAKMVSMWNDTKDWWMQELDYKTMSAYLNSASTTNDSPIFYNINGTDSAGDLVVDLYPIPNAVETINVNMSIPEAEFTYDTQTTVLPEKPIIYGTWALAISERGEDGGIPYSEADERYRRALADAIALDASHHAYQYVMRTI